MIIILFILLLIIAFLVLKVNKTQHFINYNTDKLGIIITSYGYNGIFLENTLKSFLMYVPDNSVIVVFITNSFDNVSLKLKQKYNNIYFKYTNNQKSYNISKIWNTGINICLSHNCNNIIISRDDLIFDQSVENIINYSMLNYQHKCCYIPVSNILDKSNNQHYHNYKKGPLNYYKLDEFCFAIFNKKSLITNLHSNRNNYFNPILKNAENLIKDWISRFKDVNGTTLIYSNTFVYSYFRPIETKLCIEKSCIYQINTGNYEGSSLQINNTNFKYKCDVLLYTDNFEQIWECIEKNIIPFFIFNIEFQDPKKLQRFIKTSPHLWLPYDYDISIYIDGNTSLQIFDSQIIIEKYLKNYDVACWKHPTRKKVMDEAAVIYNKKLSNLNSINRLLNMITHDGFKDNVGLTETNLLIRRHKNIVNFSNKWSDYINICHRDQLSFDYLIDKYKINHKKYEYNTKPLTPRRNHVMAFNRTI